MKNIIQRIRVSPIPLILGAVGLVSLLFCSVLSGEPAGQSADSFMNDQESRLAWVLSGIEGIGEVEVMITNRENTGFPDRSTAEPQGVIVCAQGAENFESYLRLQRAVATALDISVGQIEIYPLKEEKGE